MKIINVNIANQTVTVNNETCSFQEAGLYVNAAPYRGFTDRTEIQEYLQEKYEDENIQVVFEGEETETQQQILNLIEEKYSELSTAIMDAYVDTDSSYNTDIILWWNGDITSNNYFGSIDYRDAAIATVIKVDNQSKVAYMDDIRGGLTEEQIEVCDKNGWLSIWETNSDKPEDWDEFKATSDEFYDVVEAHMRNIKESPAYMIER